MGDQQNVEALRREYSRRALVEDEIANDPIEQFAVWFRQALAADLRDANAMMLATASAEGKPSARVVLLKGFDQLGFRFYTNYQSRKGRELEENPYASLCFFWPELERQVRIEGEVKKMSREDSATYFEKRPRLSQLGAWASSQSSEVESREVLEQNFEKMKERFDGKDIHLPEFWGGFSVQPARIEFWQGRPGRLHDRIVYKKSGDAWEIVRLSP
ncbi:MAG: pyridoxamine 5'-phosphate oxidase [Balneolaceae bacterium]|nr:pyridoxamine 5'-phosphate oxidase [Balneolaceae bacterium]